MVVGAGGLSVLFRPSNQLTLFLCSDSLLTSCFKVSPAKNEKMTYTYMHIQIEVFRPRYGGTQTDMQIPACNSYTFVQLHMPGDIAFIEIFFSSIQKQPVETSLFTLDTQFTP